MKKNLFIISLLITVSGFSQCWKSVVSGYCYHNVGIQTNGTLWAWGVNTYGQLGDSTTISKNIPTQIGSANNWKSATTHFISTLAIKTNGTLWGWGGNADGQLGDGTIIGKTVPTQIGTANNWSSVSVGFSHTLAIKTNGTLWAWGSNSFGRLGNGTFIDELLPIQIGTDTNWIKIIASSIGSLGIKSDGTLWGWGILNGANSLAVLVPTQIGTATNWKDISSTYRHALGIKTDGTIWAWGNNDNGELGNGNNLNSSTGYAATQIGTATNWKFIAAGGNFSMGIKTNGTLWAWGENTYGQYGNNTIVDSYIPIQIGTLTNWRSINLGIVHTSGFKTTNDRLWIWGSDNQGALGNAANLSSLIPVALGTTCITFSNLDFEVLANQFMVFPNPATKEINIQSINQTELKSIQINDILGKTVLEKDNDLSKVNIESLGVGIYSLIITTSENKKSVRKIIKK
jgi:alpha-tubulin suppressor-like RCC1 family protein